MIFTYRKNEIDKKTIIECPHCHAQYLAGEIFMPGAIIGKPVEVVKDSLGKIIYVDYKQSNYIPNYEERFTCDFCDKPFVVEAAIGYKAAKEAPEKDFSSPYVSLFD